MFVTKKEYDELHTHAALISEKYLNLKTRWDDLVTLINSKGGQEFLDGDTQQLSQEDIKRLLVLCHPDKHDGKQIAVEMTQKLLEMRG